jgi:NDP-sugar pyrophosphorylase family protein
MLPVVVLAGGLATRMQSFTGNIPKAMIDVAGKPFIHWQLLMLKNQGINNVILCIGHLGEMIEKYAGNGAAFGLNLTYSYDGDKLLGTGGAIKKIEEYLPEAFFILYGDSYLDIPYAPVEKAFRASGKTGLMTVYENKDMYDVSNVIFQDGELVSYCKRNKTDLMHHIDYGLGILCKDAFVDFPKYEFLDLADVYEKLANEKQLAGYEVFTRFHEIGSPEGLQELREKLGVSPL